MAGISNHYDTLVAIKAVIDTLITDGSDGMDGLVGGSVIQEFAQYEDNTQTLPFVSISPYGPEKLGDELNDRDGVYYGCLVAIIAKSGVVTLEQKLAWRQKIRRNLNNHSIDGLGQNYNLEVEPGNVVESRPYFDRKAFISGFVVRAFFQEQRT